LTFRPQNASARHRAAPRPARAACCVDTSRVHLDPEAGGAHLADRFARGGLEPRLGLRPFEPRARQRGIVRTLTDGIVDAQPDGPRREIAGEQLIEHLGEVGDLARPHDRAGKTADALQQRAAETARLIARVQPHVGQPLVARELQVRIGRADLQPRALKVGALLQGDGHRRGEIRHR
jgi:hypothetical protein